jgi:DNA replication protein DnaC
MKATPVTTQIVELTTALKLSGIRMSFQEVLTTAAAQELSYDTYLLTLLQKEAEVRHEKRKQSRLRLAGFPYKKYVEDLDTTALPSDARKKLPVLRTLEFITAGQNVILAGNPGTGKTHLAIGLGIAACLADYKVLFTTVPTLITQLQESRAAQRLRAYQNKFEKYDLVICDEFGYISFDKAGAELLFTHLSLRAGRKATIITTNLSFDRWQELFGDPVLTAALVDRLTHKAYCVNMTGGSYRLKETEAWLRSTQPEPARNLDERKEKNEGVRSEEHGHKPQRSRNE